MTELPQVGDKVRFSWWGSTSIGWVKRIYVYDWVAHDDVTIVVRDIRDNLFTVYKAQIIEVLEP